MRNLGVMLAIIASMLLSLCACQPVADTELSSAANPATQVVIQGESADEEVIQTIEIDNCDGRSDVTRTEQRTQSIEVTISTEVAAKIGASAEVVSAEVQAAVGAAIGSGAQRSTSIQLSAPPGTRMLFQLLWIGKEQVGIVQNLRGSGIPIAFQSFTPTDVRIKSQQDIGCPGSGSLQPVVTSQPSPTQPAPVQSTPMSALEPLREHYEVTVGEGLFAEGTFSDGMAPYSEQWLWDNDHFDIQRIRQEEYPSGCDVSRYNTDLVWIGGSPGMSIAINGEEVGKYTIAADSHGYIFEWPIRMGDEICAVGFVRSVGFHIILGPDIYYHYDSYCYRGHCN